MLVNFSEDQGDRKCNLDAFCCFSSSENKFFLMLADGFGDSSQEGVYKTIRNLSHLISSSECEKINPEHLESSLEESVKISFLGLSVINNSFTHVVSSGDCRVYVNGQVLSSDDSVAWKALIKRKSHDDAAKYAVAHPLRNRLTSHVEKGRKVDFKEIDFKLSSGDRVLVCTDGVWSIFHDHISSGEFSLDMVCGNIIDNGMALELVF
ncbi:PP2C family protein-serine/threonine phosphatase [Halomonas garicola]|uniref:PP2C family protein-serine/threonine phosphatase n=1 Tax=Halomonas garicola TaxID=1690008 RepID=UPI002896B5DC|nr:hypothetical protein [Halomonas garicola]